MLFNIVHMLLGQERAEIALEDLIHGGYAPVGTDRIDWARERQI